MAFLSDRKREMRAWCEGGLHQDIPLSHVLFKGVELDRSLEQQQIANHGCKSKWTQAHEPQSHGKDAQQNHNRPQNQTSQQQCEPSSDLAQDQPAYPINPHNVERCLNNERKSAERLGRRSNWEGKSRSSRPRALVWPGESKPGSA